MTDNSRRPHRLNGHIFEQRFEPARGAGYEQSFGFRIASQLVRRTVFADSDLR